MQVRYKPKLKIKSARVVIEYKKTSSLQVAKPPTDERIHSLPLRNQILNAAEIGINVAGANVLIDTCTVVPDLISAQVSHLHNIPREEIPPKSWITAIKGSKSPIRKMQPLQWMCKIIRNSEPPVIVTSWTGMQLLATLCCIT